ncbi:uL15 family ribosomal protein [Candidatus Woesearchaeota archaeon]|nr:uL15 family ribosomal protein [Candidatus Woesearchaeota archaeon]
MVVNKRRKHSRLRGSHTHGWGAMKKHRGSGNRGGAGHSGTGKRAESNMPSIWHIKGYFGKHGFVNRGHRVSMRSVTLSWIEEHVEKLVAKNLAKREGSAYSVNLDDLGYNKLLVKGRVVKRLIIRSDYASRNAITAVEAAGGQVILSKKEEKSDGVQGAAAKSS